ncbi:hypothetical protein BDZ94DRAFT_1258381 [Collybia nuda]|uniref:Uncharacterized protein n=1 Tax=Collybia nuda TaxID=64659 RepID=A0A9P6CKC8_9AGAR|nr:hypothetical protein BDZ94DRAFT_1258381 [Collybia nuda]
MSELPNMGIEPGMEEPVNIDHLYKDPKTEELDVEVMITKDTGHWKIIWKVGTNSEGHEVHRQLHIVREVGHDHLTNWGPYTATAEFGSLTAPRVFVKNMPYPQRRSLEEIALRTKVMAPDGVWDCQTWVREVFAEAVKTGLLSSAESYRTLSEVERETQTS